MYIINRSVVLRRRMDMSLYRLEVEGLESSIVTGKGLELRVKR